MVTIENLILQGKISMSPVYIICITILLIAGIAMIIFLCFAMEKYAFIIGPFSLLALGLFLVLFSSVISDESSIPIVKDEYVEQIAKIVNNDDNLVVEIQDETFFVMDKSTNEIVLFENDGYTVAFDKIIKK